MRYIVLFSFILYFSSCETDNFNADKRQIMAKDLMRSKIGQGSRGFDVLAFKEDTLAAWQDSTLKNPIQYTIDFVYNDSLGISQNKKGRIIFAPDGKSIIGYNIAKR